MTVLCCVVMLSSTEKLCTVSIMYLYTGSTVNKYELREHIGPNSREI